MLMTKTDTLTFDTSVPDTLMKSAGRAVYLDRMFAFVDGAVIAEAKSAYVREADGKTIATILALKPASMKVADVFPFRAGETHVVCVQWAGSGERIQADALCESITCRSFADSDSHVEAVFTMPRQDWR